MPNYVQYQPSKYESMFVPYDMGTLSKAVNDRQQRSDTAQQAYGQQMAKLGQEETTDPLVHEQVMQNLRQGFEKLYAKHNGNLSAGYNDAINYVQNARQDPYWNLKDKKLEGIKQENALRSQYGNDALVFNSVRSAPIMDASGNYVDPQSFVPEVQKKDNWNASMLEAVKTHSKPFKTGKSLGRAGYPGLLKTTEYTGGEVNEAASWDDYQKSSSYSQQLKTYTKLGEYTPDGEKMDEDTAKKYIRQQFDGIVKDHQYKLIDQNYMGDPQSSGSSGGGGGSVRQPEDAVNATVQDATKATTSYKYKTFETANEARRTNNRAIYETANDLLTYMPGASKGDLRYGTPGYTAAMAVKQREITNLIEEYKTNPQKVYAKLRITGYPGSEETLKTKMGSIYMAQQEASKIDAGMEEFGKKAGMNWNDLKNMDPSSAAYKTGMGKINDEMKKVTNVLTATNSWSLDPAFNTLGYDTPQAQKAQEELFNRTLTVANLKGGALFKGSVFDANGKPINDGQLEDIGAYLRKINIDDATKVESRLTTTPSDIGSNGQQQQAFIVSMLDKDGRMIQLRIPMEDAVKDNYTLDILKNSPTNKLNKFIGSGVQYGYENFDMRNIDPTMLDEISRMPEFLGTNNIEINYGGSVNTPGNFQATIRRNDGSIEQMKADEFIKRASSAYRAKATRALQEANSSGYFTTQN